MIMSVSETTQLIFIVLGIAINIGVVLSVARNSERRLTRIEVYLKQCCAKMEIHTGEL
jgi:hypothetical protein